MKRKNYARYGMLIFATLLLLGVCFLGASPTTIKSVAQFDDMVSSPSKPVTVVLATSQPEVNDKASKKQQEAVKKGFNELSKQKLYKKADVQFALVDVGNFSSLQREFTIKQLTPTTINFVLYHKGKFISIQPLPLLESDKNIKDLVADKGQRFIDKEAGDIIDDIIQDKQDREWELQKLRAQAPVYYSSPFYYDPWWGYGGYGYGWGGWYGGYRHGCWW